jgi:NADH-quinone oxidoreductase subunit E
MALFEGRTAGEAEAIVARYPAAHRRSAVMPLLYLAQSIEGMVTRDGLREIAELLDITTAEVEAVATFYTMYRLRPTGTHLVNVCTNLACKLRGADDVYRAAQEECLGVCDFAPAVQIDFANHDNVTPERMRALIARLRGGEVPAPARGPAVESFRGASRVLAGLVPDGTEVPSA